MPDVACAHAYGLIFLHNFIRFALVLVVLIYSCASLLPRGRGAAPIQRSNCVVDAETGISIMQMDFWVGHSDGVADVISFGLLMFFFYVL